jgi:hypothetical protein
MARICQPEVDFSRFQQKQADLEQQVAKVHASVMGIQFQERRLDSLENLVLGLRQQVDSIMAAEQARQVELPLLVKGIIDQVVQEQMAFLWEHLGAAQKEERQASLWCAPDEQKLARIAQEDSALVQRDGENDNDKSGPPSTASSPWCQYLTVRVAAPPAPLSLPCGDEHLETQPNRLRHEVNDATNDGTSSEAPSAAPSVSSFATSLTSSGIFAQGAGRPPPCHEALFRVINRCDEVGAVTMLASPDFSDLNAVNSKGESALHRAAWFGLSRVCQALLHRTDFTVVMAKDSKSMTALHCAAWRGQIEAVRSLLADGQLSAAVWYEDNLGMTPLHRAALCGHAEVCQELMRPDSEAKLLECRAQGGKTPLHLAAKAGHAEVCRALLRCEDIVEAVLALQDDEGFTALQIAKGKALRFLQDLSWEGG